MVLNASCSIRGVTFVYKGKLYKYTGALCSCKSNIRNVKVRIGVIMGYSKETERQNKVLGDLLSGKEPEKRVMVGYENKKRKSGDKKVKMTL